MSIRGAVSRHLDEPLTTTLRRPSLRSQLNQIRLWLRQGRTDAWIAHKLDISVDDLVQFKREHQLDGEPAPSLAPLTAGEPPPELEDLEEPVTDDDGDLAGDEAEDEEDDYEDEDEDEDEEDEDEASERTEARRRRRGRRGGRRRRSRRTVSYEGTFEHGDEGYGLWLDPAVADNDVYSEHWAGHREVTVSVEPDAITIRRAE
jgi:hypothetical protein